MDNKQVKTHIEDIIQNATNRVAAAFNDDVSKTRLCFPKYSSGKIRVSEQEFRFAFVESFIDYVITHNLDWRYAVEVPTEDNYYFSGESGPEIAKEGERGRSASFDLLICDGVKSPLCIIEFKAENPEQSCYSKDYLKLMNKREGRAETLRYFIQLVKSHDDGTILSIEEKTSEASKKIKQGMPVVSYAFSLKNGKVERIFHRDK